MKTDTSGGVWAVDSQNKRILYASSTPGAFFILFKQLTDVPGGIAVDSTRGLIYVSDVNVSSIHVHTQQAQDLTTFS